MKRILVFILALFMVQIGVCKSYVIRSEKEFYDIRQCVNAGDKIVIANNVYSAWNLILDFNGTESNPIIICAESKGKVVFSGDCSLPIFQIRGAYIVIDGLTFSTCNVYKNTGVVSFDGAKYSKLINCTFADNRGQAQYIPLVMVARGAQDNSINNCAFIRSRNILDIKVQVVNSNSYPIRTSIESNVFQDKPKVTWGNGNGGECIQIGQDNVLLGQVKTECNVADNKFVRCSGDAEVISNKSSRNVYVRNYLENCIGELVLRGGEDCLVDKNIIKGGKSGIRVSGARHRIVNNDISDVATGIRLLYGMTRRSEEKGFYVTASNCIIKDNSIKNAKVGILIGDQKNLDWTGKFDKSRYPSRMKQDIAPFKNSVSGNSFFNVFSNMVKQ